MAITAQEYRDRHEKIREAMRREGYEVLIVAGREDIYSRGHVRYVTDLARGGFLVFPRDENPVFFVHPAYVTAPKPARDRPVHDFVTLQVYADGAYGDPVLDVLGEHRRLGITTGIGFVGMRDVSAQLFEAVSEFATEPPRDATPLMWEARKIKTPEMLALMRESGRVADEAVDVLLERAVPGAVDYDLFADVKAHLFRSGSEYSLEVIDAEGANMNFAWYPTGDRLVDGGTLMMEITPAIGGVYCQLPFSLLVGEPGAQLRDMKDAWFEGFSVGESMLKPGTRVGDLSRAMKASINARGYLTQGHAIGLDVLDGWAIGDATDVVLEPGMTMALHPAAVAELGGASYSSGYTYLITEDGAERLSRHDFSR